MDNGQLKMLLKANNFQIDTFSNYQIEIIMFVLNNTTRFYEPGNDR